MLQYMLVRCRTLPRRLGSANIYKPRVYTSSTQMPDPINRVDLRIGHVGSVECHPDAESLYVLKVDMGEPDKRCIVSGLVDYYSSEQLLDKNIVLFANMRPRKLRGILSQGMLLAVTNAEVDSINKVEVLEAPATSIPGERVLVLGGEDNGSMVKPQINQQKIVRTFLESLALKEKVAEYKGQTLITLHSIVSSVVGWFPTQDRSWSQLKRYCQIKPIQAQQAVEGSNPDVCQSMVAYKKSKELVIQVK